MLLPELPQLPAESPGWTWFPTMSVAEPRRGRAGRVQGPVELDAMTTGFAAIAAAAPRTRLGQGNGEDAQSVTPARRWSMPIFMAVFGPKMLMIEGGACAVLRRLCRQ